ncbi:hypothetical protein D9758_003657 [Tetrapyrgos nigripes]|uniref:Protein-lysine N-methyltransferase EFM4 n=1 Tax=Tetrapyrgos nigripes TaxID=182062 RepID=A0A8H5LRL2_9AGAR|nr:hypothetical protein D9758_003657 [Tetrapyrgos nigripes]
MAFQPSKLGTKEHWDKVYEEELANFKEIGDEGEIWFGEESVDKMVEWTEENLPPSDDLSILEIGSGNGTLLFALAEAGYSQKVLSGIDYSPDAVNLSQAIAATREMNTIQFNVCNFLAEDTPTLPKMAGSTLEAWDLLLDKGTYDAIGLGVKDDEGKSPAAKYPARAARLMKPGGFFLITSCNFTEDELKTAFSACDTGLQYHSRIQHPTFSYGGKSGSIVSTVAFQKKSQIQM